MSPNPLISIVIPTYNGGHYLIETLKSALAQDYDNMEIIVVDDGSQTDIKRTISEFGDQVKLISQENAGPGAARKLGASQSKGEFIAFLDHDDLWSTQKVSEQVAALIQNPDCALVYCYPVLIDEQGRLIPNTPPQYFPEGNVFEDFIKRNRITTYSATMVRRSAYMAVGGIDDSLNIMTCDDYDLWLRLAAWYKVGFVAGPHVFYRIHPGNFLNNHQLNMDAHLNVMEKCRNFICENSDLAKHFDYERAIVENQFHCYRKFGFIYNNDFPDSNLEARKALKKSLELSPLDIKCRVYYLFTFEPFVLARKVKQAIAV